MSYSCRQLELGRSGMVAESMIKWEGSPIPAPYIYYRTSSKVAYAEFCAPGDMIEAHWNDIVTAAMMAAKAVGVRMIIDEPNASLAAFESNFQTLLARNGVAEGGKILISLSARQQPNKEWHR